MDLLNAGAWIRGGVDSRGTRSRQTSPRRSPSTGLGCSHPVGADAQSIWRGTSPSSSVSPSRSRRIRWLLSTPRSPDPCGRPDGSRTKSSESSPDDIHRRHIVPKWTPLKSCFNAVADTTASASTAARRRPNPRRPPELLEFRSSLSGCDRDECVRWNDLPTSVTLPGDPRPFARTAAEQRPDRHSIPGDRAVPRPST